MTQLLFSLFLACAPSKLETDAAATVSDSAHPADTIPSPPIDPVGVIPDSDCSQLNRGDTACNFALVDQNGNVWELYQHQGKVIVLDFSAMWCGPCQTAANYAQPLQDDYGMQDVVVVTILIDGPRSGIEPTSYEVDQWVSDHNITTAPVLEGSRDKMLSTDANALDGYLLGGFPTYVYIGRDLKFYAAHVGFSDEAARYYIEEGL
jgi:thiol-disulfide isomerase/thioredoxin